MVDEFCVMYAILMKTPEVKMSIVKHSCQYSAMFIEPPKSYPHE